MTRGGTHAAENITCCFIFSVDWLTHWCWLYSVGFPYWCFISVSVTNDNNKRDFYSVHLAGQSVLQKHQQHTHTHTHTHTRTHARTLARMHAHMHTHTHTQSKDKWKKLQRKYKITMKEPHLERGMVGKVIVTWSEFWAWFPQWLHGWYQWWWPFHPCLVSDSVMTVAIRSQGGMQAETYLKKNNTY